MVLSSAIMCIYLGMLAAAVRLPAMPSAGKPVVMGFRRFYIRVSSSYFLAPTIFLTDLPRIEAAGSLVAVLTFHKRLQVTKKRFGFHSF